jgi:hypothetical protein
MTRPAGPAGWPTRLPTGCCLARGLGCWSCEWHPLAAPGESRARHPGSLGWLPKGLDLGPAQEGGWVSAGTCHSVPILFSGSGHDAPTCSPFRPSSRLRQQRRSPFHRMRAIHKVSRRLLRPDLMSSGSARSTWHLSDCSASSSGSNCSTGSGSCCRTWARSSPRTGCCPARPCGPYDPTLP